MELRHQLDEFVINWILNLFTSHQLWIQIREDLHLRVEDHLLPEGFFLSQRIGNLAIDHLPNRWFHDANAILASWLKDVELRLDPAAFQGFDLFLFFEHFQSMSLFLLLAFLLFHGALEFELFLFGQSDLFVLFSFLSILLLSLEFSFLSFESGFFLGVQSLESEKLFLCKPFLSLCFLKQALFLFLFAFLFQAPFLFLSSPSKLFELLLADLHLLRLFPLFFLSFLFSSSLEFLLPLQALFF